MHTNGSFTIGTLARRTGLNVRTIRFYSDEGLLPPTDRTAAGYRIYDARSLAALELVKTLRALGLGLTEVKGMLAGQTTVVEIAQRHVATLDEQIRLLTLRRAVLRAVTRRRSDIDEVRLMNKLVAMSDDERTRLIDEFWDEATTGLNIDPEFSAGMRSAKPHLPTDPTAEQLEAWIELAELVQDKDFRQRIRTMGESHSAARDAGESMAAPDEKFRDAWLGWTAQVRQVMADGHGPDSPTARLLADQVATALATAPEQAADPAFRTVLADRIAVGTDTRAERYWQLMAIINGWTPIPSQVPAAEWLVAALRASTG